VLPPSEKQDWQLKRQQPFDPLNTNNRLHWTNQCSGALCPQGGFMIYSTTESIPGKEIEKIVGVVTGNVVQAKHIGRDIMAGLKSIVGGEIRGYTEMLTDARDIAIQRLIENAQEKGADAVVGIRFTTSSIMDGSSEIMVFGTAVKLKT
jgi:uncharacterized protein YbjQ (UPF0145 family)